MQEGLAFVGLMAAVVATAAAINVASPSPTAVQQVIQTPASTIEFPGPPAVFSPPAIPVSGVPSVAPAIPSEVPQPVPRIPLPEVTATIRPPVESPVILAPEPTFVPPVPDPPPTNEPCPIGLEIDPLLGVCVVI